MKILWITNVKPAFICELENEMPIIWEGWLDDFGRRIAGRSDRFILLYLGNKRENKQLMNIDIYEFNESDDNETYFSSIIENTSPDVIHIWGTEYKHSYELYAACEKQNLQDRALISIQGIIVIYKYHWLAGLPLKVFKRNLLDVIMRRAGMAKQLKEVSCRSGFEENLLRKCKNVIGRTRWDYGCTKLLSQGANYYKCNESLRPSFYNTTWDCDKCEKHSIFGGQCGHQIKGFHNLIEAVYMLRDVYHDIKVYATGRKLNELSYFRMTPYERYLIGKIKKYGLMDHFFFVGYLDEQQMCDIYKKANVYVNASVIENSSNTIGEAMVVGTPCVISDVGGAHDMLKDTEEGFIYPFDEYYMLAHYIDRIFQDPSLAKSISERARRHGLERHDREGNYNRLLEIYDGVVEGGERTIV